MEQIKPQMPIVTTWHLPKREPKEEPEAPVQVRSHRHLMAAGSLYGYRVAARAARGVE